MWHCFQDRQILYLIPHFSLLFIFSIAVEHCHPFDLSKLLHERLNLLGKGTTWCVETWMGHFTRSINVSNQQNIVVDFNNPISYRKRWLTTFPWGVTSIPTHTHKLNEGKPLGCNNAFTVPGNSPTVAQICDNLCQLQLCDECVNWRCAALLFVQEASCGEFIFLRWTVPIHGYFFTPSVILNLLKMKSVWKIGRLPQTVNDKTIYYGMFRLCSLRVLC